MLCTLLTMAARIAPRTAIVARTKFTFIETSLCTNVNNTHCLIYSSKHFSEVVIMCSYLYFAEEKHFGTKR